MNESYFVPSGEKKLRELIESTKDLNEQHWDVDDIMDIVTAENLCSCQDPITMAFKVNILTLGKTIVILVVYYFSLKSKNRLVDRQ